MQNVKTPVLVISLSFLMYEVICFDKKTVLGEIKKDGTHKTFALQNCDICKQGSENRPVNLSNRSSHYVAQSSTKMTRTLSEILDNLTSLPVTLFALL